MIHGRDWNGNCWMIMGLLVNGAAFYCSVFLVHLGRNIVNHVRDMETKIKN